MPANSALTDLHALIDDRLFKIRSCRDIEGNVRSLLLWEPPLDPGAVLRALANGLPLGSIAENVVRTSANFRFKYLIKVAFDICAEVQRLGANILKLRRRKDIELLEVLRVSQQRIVTERMKEVADQEVEEAEQGLELIMGNITDAEDRMKLYLRLLGEDLGKIPKSADFTPLEYSLGTRVKHLGSPMSKNQRDAINLTLSSLVLRRGVPGLRTAAAAAASAPDSWNTVGSLPPAATTTWFGGGKISDGITKGANVLEALADVPAQVADYVSLWKDVEDEHLENQLQANEAGKEISGCYIEAAAQTARLQQAKTKRLLREQQLQHHADMDRFLRTKYTNADLYTWTINSLQRLYHESYNQALDVATQAEWAFRFERGDAPTRGGSGFGTSEPVGDAFIKSGYWNAGYDGLLAGESLAAALHRLQAAHVSAREHDFEITRSISLRQVAPVALLRLRAPSSASTGTFDLPETLWDMDFPGHYNRRIRSVKLRILSSRSAAAPLNVTLTLLKHRFRVTADVSDGYAEVEKEDARFFSYAVPVSSVAVSSSQSSAGVFELDFDSERYMPFEGAGLIRYVALHAPVSSRAPYIKINDVLTCCVANGNCP